VYDLRTGQRVPDIRRAPPHAPLPQMTTVTDDGRLFYGATVKGHGTSTYNCVVRVDLNTWVTTLLECAADGSSEDVGRFLYASEDGAAWVREDAQDEQSCRGGSGISGRRLVTIAECRTFAVMFLGGWSVWSTSPVDGYFGDLPLRASDGRRTVELGRVESWRLTTCGRYAYWNPPSGKTNRLLRWRPGQPHVEVAYESPNRDDNGRVDLQSIGGCADDILTLRLLADGGGPGPRVRVLALDSTA
jgi:hypothetical protein